jgi:hypothetical protein
LTSTLQVDIHGFELPSIPTRSLPGLKINGGKIRRNVSSS